MPTSFVAVERKVATVRRRRDAFELEHGFARRWAAARRTDLPVLEKMGIHRALRLAGCAPGDRVRLGGHELEWSFPRRTELMPAGTGKWSCRADGVRGYRVVFTRSPVKDLSGADAADRARGLAPRVARSLLRAR